MQDEQHVNNLLKHRIRAVVDIREGCMSMFKKLPE
jgi:hypothetical protein